MESYGLLSICISAIIAVFLILTLLAIIIRLITDIFPSKNTEDDSAVLAALSTVINQYYPGTKITNIKEIK
jgi:hypothetical protein